jgi:hypothetical protein
VGSKGFAYLGIAPLYIGEMVLAASLALFAFAPNFRAVLGSFVSLPFFLLVCLCLLRTLPLIDEYGVYALRDSVVYGYILFAVLLAGCIATPHAIVQGTRMYEYAALAALPVILVLLLAVGRGGPGLEDEQAITLKPGDTAVHLTGILSFLMLGLGRQIDRRDNSRSSLLFRTAVVVAWIIAALLALWCASLSRGAMLSMLLGLLVLFAWGFNRRLIVWTMLAVTVILAVSFLLDLRIETERREISARQVVANFLSVFDVDAAHIVGSGIDADALGATANWRLYWWTDIVDYTFFGDLFWNGHGFGPNLATIDGYQVDPDDQLRSPHNVHMTFLARAGVPGFLLWIASQVAFGAALVRASLRMRRIGAQGWLRVNVWVTAYWVAALTNASFDVYLEGPQGGIWFWCIIGFAMALMHVEKMAYRQQAEPKAVGRPGISLPVAAR